jgi:hypothetical protein
MASVGVSLKLPSGFYEPLGLRRVFDLCLCLSRRAASFGLSTREAICECIKAGGGYIRDCQTFWKFEGTPCPGSFISLYKVCADGRLTRLL